MNMFVKLIHYPPFPRDPVWLLCPLIDKLLSMPGAKKIRLDQLLVERGLFPSRTRAQAAIMAGVVSIDGFSNLKAGDRVPVDVKVNVKETDCPYVSRGGLKLEGALDHLKIDPTGMNVLDIGASTGGFTDCLLKKGAKHVTALDVGRGLIAWSLRNHPSVSLIERTNARSMTPEIAPGPFDLIVIDVSFISLKLIFPNLPDRMSDGSILLALIKPQFEAGRDKVVKGFVKDPETWREILESFITPEIFKSELAPGLAGFTRSTIKGKDGNVEFFGMWVMGSEGRSEEELEGEISDVVLMV